MQLLRDSYRWEVLRATLTVQYLQTVLAALRNAGIEPLLIKGWGISRLYPAPGMRPCGDLDLCVSAQQYSVARKILKELEVPDVDLHRGVQNEHGHLRDICPLEDLQSRAERVPLGDTNVLVPCPEDHLRITCLHMMSSGAYRPIWLCDVALQMELAGPDFNWETCLGPDKRRWDWVFCSMSLASQLLGARLPNEPRVVEQMPSLPGWLPSEIIKAWGMGRQGAFEIRWDHPLEMLRQLYERWPSPLRCLEYWNGPISRMSDRWLPLGDWPYRTLRRVARSAFGFGVLPQKNKKGETQR